MEVSIFGYSDVGLKRQGNEDRYGILEKEKLVIVCDGMGGHNAGEVASRLVVDNVISFFQSLTTQNVQKICADIPFDLPEPAKRMIACIRLANHRVYSMSLTDPANKGMGSTIVSGLFFENKIIAAHVGDSRIYRYRQHSLEQITKDHSWFNELIDVGEIQEQNTKDFDAYNIITRAIGISKRMKIDLLIDTVQEGDIYLFCTDGLSGPVPDNQIAKFFEETQDDEEDVRQLIAAANRNGGPDNITAVTVKIRRAKATRPSFENLKITIPEESNSIRDELENFGNMTSVPEVTQLLKSKKSRTGITVITLLIFLCAIIFAFIWWNSRDKDTLSKIEDKDVYPKPLLKTTVPESVKQIPKVNPEQGILYITSFDKEIRKDAIIFIDGLKMGIIDSLGERPSRDFPLNVGKHQIKIIWRNKLVLQTVTILKDREFTISLNEILKIE